MGIWHKPWQVAMIIKKIENDYSSQKLFEFELAKGWTDASKRKHYWRNTTQRIFNLTGKHYTCFINKKTVAYKHILKYYLDMSLKFTKDPNRRKILQDADKEDLITMIEIMEEEINKSKEEKSKKDKTKSLCKLINKISINSSLSERKLTLYFKVNRKTYHNYKNVVGHGNIFRKDYKHNNWYFKNLVLNMFNDFNWTQGAYKISGILNKSGVKISTPTVRRILRDSQLYVSTLSKKYIPKELKDTKQKREYLVNPEIIRQSKVGELFSLDFMYIKTNHGNKYVHGAIDIVSQQIVSLVFTDTMSSSVVRKTINELPSTVKIINTDYGKQYFEKEVIDLLKQKNISHSCGNVGKSTDNGWIERFWKRLRCECLNTHDTFNLSNLYLQQLIEQYKTFWNTKRVISTLDWLTPNKFAILNSGVN